MRRGISFERLQSLGYDQAMEQGSLQSDLSRLVKWSTECNLVLNASKTKTILFSSTQMSKRHNLDHKDTFQINNNDQPLERVDKYKLLGMTFTEHLTWNDHINKVVTSSYSTLRSLKKIKRMTPFNLRKQLAECLVLSKIDFGNVIYENMPTYLVRSVQKVQNATAGYVLNRYSRESDVIKLNWLPAQERIQHSIANLTYNALTNPNWPSYFRLNYHEPARTLRSSSNGKLLVNPRVKGTLKTRAAEIFNNLPTDIRNTDSFHSYSNKVKTHFKCIAKARLT